MADPPACCHARRQRRDDSFDRDVIPQCPNSSTHRRNSAGSFAPCDDEASAVAIYITKRSANFKQIGAPFCALCAPGGACVCLAQRGKTFFISIDNRPHTFIIGIYSSEARSGKRQGFASAFFPPHTLPGLIRKGASIYACSGCLYALQ